MVEQAPPTALGIEDILGKIQRPERAFRLCLRADLQSQWEETERLLKLAERESTNSLAGNTKKVRDLAKQCRALEQEMETATVTLLLRGISSKKFSDLLAAHPARKGQDEAFNAETFGVALLAASAATPEMNEEQAGRLVDSITSGQWNDLFNTCWLLNRSSVDVPFSRTASEHLPGTKTS
ncbi:hypothetical protein GCM10009530_63860 [Microbispora corallina]|uniref:DUF222 domain-containing protein n=1 Tax=Microbispora corallina TaxID=83302 RepID=A0ABQ4GBZ6_9ACTN|nr:hypothetical protein [Microbispora corallina]GIH44609.1 hypothetical protein Mco01_76090 [Microbispora corallina]